MKRARATRARVLPPCPSSPSCTSPRRAVLILGHLHLFIRGHPRPSPRASLYPRFTPPSCLPLSSSASPASSTSSCSPTVMLSHVLFSRLSSSCVALFGAPLQKTDRPTDRVSERTERTSERDRESERPTDRPRRAALWKILRRPGRFSIITRRRGTPASERGSEGNLGLGYELCATLVYAPHRTRTWLFRIAHTSKHTYTHTYAYASAQEVSVTSSLNSKTTVYSRGNGLSIFRYNSDLRDSLCQRRDAKRPSNSRNAIHFKYR